MNEPFEYDEDDGKTYPMNVVSGIKVLREHLDRIEALVLAHSDDDDLDRLDDADLRLVRVGAQLVDVLHLLESD
jgi:hypothetical protein